MSKSNILLVEDDEALSSVYQLIFQQSGYSLLTANNGQSGLFAARQHMPSLILVDVQMPVMGGLEMVRKLRKEPWGKNPKIIILTNSNNVDLDVNKYNISEVVLKVELEPDNLVELAQKYL